MDKEIKKDIKQLVKDLFWCECIGGENDLTTEQRKEVYKIVCNRIYKNWDYMPENEFDYIMKVLSYIANAMDFVRWGYQRKKKEMTFDITLMVLQDAINNLDKTAIDNAIKKAIEEYEPDEEMKRLKDRLIHMEMIAAVFENRD